MPIFSSEGISVNTLRGKAFKSIPYQLFDLLDKGFLKINT